MVKPQKSGSCGQFCSVCCCFISFLAIIMLGILLGLIRNDYKYFKLKGIPRTNAYYFTLIALLVYIFFFLLSVVYIYIYWRRARTESAALELQDQGTSYKALKEMKEIKNEKKVLQKSVE